MGLLHYIDGGGRCSPWAQCTVMESNLLRAERKRARMKQEGDQRKSTDLVMEEIECMQRVDELQASA